MTLIEDLKNELNRHLVEFDKIPIKKSKKGLVIEDKAVRKMIEQSGICLIQMVQRYEKN